MRENVARIETQARQTVGAFALLGAICTGLRISSRSCSRPRAPSREAWRRIGHPPDEAAVVFGREAPPSRYRGDEILFTRRAKSSTWRSLDSTGSRLILAIPVSRALPQAQGTERVYLIGTLALARWRFP